MNLGSIIIDSIFMFSDMFWQSPGCNGDEVLPDEKKGSVAAIMSFENLENSKQPIAGRIQKRELAEILDIIHSAATDETDID